MRVLAVSLAAVFMFMGVPALSSAASADSFRSVDSSCRARKKKAKKQTADNKKKGKGDKKAYGFEL
jgi:hypothetical protein